MRQLTKVPQARSMSPWPRYSFLLVMPQNVEDVLLIRTDPRGGPTVPLSPPPPTDFNGPLLWFPLPSITSYPYLFLQLDRMARASFASGSAFGRLNVGLNWWRFSAVRRNGVWTAFDNSACGILSLVESFVQDICSLLADFAGATKLLKWAGRRSSSP